MIKFILPFVISILANGMLGTAQTIEIGAAVNNQIASLPRVTQNSQTWTQGTVTIAAGTYSQSTTIVLNSPYLDLRCEPGTVLIYTGSGDAIRILPSVQISGPAQTQPNQGPSVENCSIYNTSPTAISGIHAGDISKIHLKDVAVNNFSGTSTSAAFWFDNTVSFTEGMALVDITSNNNSIAMRFTNTAGTPFSNSFGYTSIRGFRAQVRTNQSGFSVETGTHLYHSYIDGIVETADASGTVMAVSGTGMVGGNAGDDVVFIRGECVNSSGTCTGSTLLSLGPQTQFVANGFMNALGTTMTTTIAPGAVFTWNGTTALNGSTYNFGWSGANSILMRFANTPSVAIYSNNMRLRSPYVVGWSTNPTTAGNYVGFSPCATGVAILCLGNGGAGNYSAGLSAGTFSGAQFVGNSALPLVSAGPGAGVVPTGVSLSPGSTNVSGAVFFTTDSSPSPSSAAITITFANPLAQQPSVCIPASLNAATANALHSLIIELPSTTGFVISTGSMPLAANTYYRIGYACF
jgi:hypothetical protein